MRFKSIFRAILNAPTVIKNRIIFAIHNVKYPSQSLIRGKLHIVNKGTIIIGNNCSINGKDKYNPIGCGEGCNLIVENGGYIKIGNNFGMSNSTIFSRTSVCIGDRVLIGAGVKIYDTDFHSLSAEWRGTKEDRYHAVNKPVIIEDDVFIGAGSFILKGVHIGRASIIGAGSVVTKDIPAGEIWAGNPAIFIRENK